MANFVHSMDILCASNFELEIENYVKPRLFTHFPLHQVLFSELASVLLKDFSKAFTKESLGRIATNSFYEKGRLQSDKW